MLMSKREGLQRGKGLQGLFVLTVVLFLVLFTSGCDMDRAEATRQLNQGMAAMSGGDTSAAVAHMEAALQADPGFAEAAYYLGQVYHMRTRDLEQALRYYRRAYDLDPENPRYSYRLATVLALSEDHEEAVRYFERAIDSAPDYARAYFSKGRSLEADQKFSEALQAYMRAIEINPRLRMTADDPGGEHYHALGDLYLRFRLFDHAARVYENGFANNLNSPRLSLGLGTALLGLGRASEAAQAFRQTLEIDPRNGPANFNLVVALRDAGDLDGAIAHGENLLETGAGLNEGRARALQLMLDDLREEKDDEEDS